MTYLWGEGGSREIVPFLYSSILIPAEFGNSCFDEHHQEMLSGLNYSIVLHEFGMLCAERLGIFKKQ